MIFFLGKQSRLLNADSPHKSFYPPIKETDVSKTDLNPGKAKSYGVDYSLYNYGKRKLKKDSDQIYRQIRYISFTGF